MILNYWSFFSTAENAERQKHEIYGVLEKHMANGSGGHHGVGKPFLSHISGKVTGVAGKGKWE